MPEVFEIPEELKITANLVEHMLLDQVTMLTFTLMASGLGERESASFIANVLVKQAWHIAMTERVMHGESPSPTTFLDMVKNHLPSDEEV